MMAGRRVLYAVLLLAFAVISWVTYGITSRNHQFQQPRHVNQPVKEGQADLSEQQAAPESDQQSKEVVYEDNLAAQLAEDEQFRQNGRITTPKYAKQLVLAAIHEQNWAELETILKNNRYVANMSLDDRYSLLGNSIDEGNLTAMKLLLKYGADVNRQTSAKIIPIRLTTPLTLAVSRGDIQSVRLLIRHGANVNAKGGYPLHRAVYTSSLEIMQDLLKANADVNRLDERGRAPIFEVKCLEAVKLLLAHKADVNVTDINGRSPIFFALTKYYPDDEILFLKRQNFLVTSKLVSMMKNFNSDEYLRLLIEHGADVNIRDKWDRTPLYVACEHANTTAVSLLVRHGADVAEKTLYGETTILHRAVKTGNSEIINILIKNGAPVNAKDNTGATPLSIVKEKLDEIAADIERMQSSKSHETRSEPSERLIGDRNSIMERNIAITRQTKLAVVTYSNIMKYLIAHGAKE